MAIDTFERSLMNR